MAIALSSAVNLAKFVEPKVKVVEEVTLPKLLRTLTISSLVIKIAVDKLKAYFETANKFCEQQNFKKAIKYFKKTIPLLEGDTIDVLRISDFNTKGLRGASTAGTDFTTPWFRLVRSVGSSDKADGSIGAFGSGKMAAFSCSDLQTVFYSTLVEDECVAYQGVSKIIGFLDEENHLCSDIGYFSEAMSMPIMGTINLEDNSNAIDVLLVVGD